MDNSQKTPEVSLDTLRQRLDNIRLRLSECEAARRSRDLYWSFMEGWCEGIADDPNASAKDKEAAALIRDLLENRHD